MLVRIIERWWVLPTIVCVLRGLPFLVTQQAGADPSTAWIPVAYVPKDFLAYVAMLRQVPDGEAVLFVNPFTTEPQSGRLVLLLFLALGWISRLTGLDPFWTLELSRIPLCFGFFWTLRRFCRLVLADRMHQHWAYWLVGLSGGLEVAARLARPWLPESVRATITQDLWHLQGWSTFGALFNPLWIVGLTLTLLALEPVLRPEGPSRLRDVVQLAVAVVLLHWTHVYSEIVVLAVVVMRPLVEWLLGAGVEWRRVWRTLAGVCAAMVVVVPVLAWQLGDAVFRRSSSGVWGTQDLPVFWYPLSLGVLLVFAVWGMRQLAASDHPWWAGLAAWVLAVVLLHTSPVVNGYHFVFHLHLPIAIVAAPAVAETLRRLRTSAATLWVGVIGVGLFLSPAVVTWESLGDVRRESRVAASVAALVEAIASEPPGNVLAPVTLGNLIPAFGAHRVWVGHWFLTPDYQARARAYAVLVGTPGREGELASLLARERIRYLVVPPETEARLTAALGPRIERAKRPAGAVVLVLRAPAS